MELNGLGSSSSTVAAGSSSNGASSSSAAQQQQQARSPVGVGWQARWFKQQQGVTRYNCADSLDRTNVGSFFGAVQVRARVALCACGWKRRCGAATARQQLLLQHTRPH